MSFTPPPIDDESLQILIELMRGRDPSQKSEIYELLAQIDDGFMDQLPTLAQWQQLGELIIDKYRQEVVPAKLCLKAAEIVTQYRQPKIKAQEGSNGDGDNNAATPLSLAEIEIFKEQFNADF